MNTKNRKVYFNGKFVDERDAKVSIYDSSLMFGDMVFEMTRSFNGKQWKLREHLERLYSGIKILKIPIKMSIDEMESAVLETIKINENTFQKDDEHRVMIDVSRGLLSIYENIEGIDAGPNIIIADFPLRWTVQGISHVFDTGINLHITSQRAIPSTFLDPKIKNRSRLFYLMANIEVSKIKGKDNWALLIDQNGYVTEGTGCNFFIVKDNTLITPVAGDLLIGITRNTILEDLAPALGLKTVERNIEPFEVYNADEAFVAATPFCILPATSLNSVVIGNGKPGYITMKLLEKWSEIVNLDIVKQIKNWDNANTSHKEIKISPYKFKDQK